jgi:osmoprotectant transport system substrate-binding protein
MARGYSERIDRARLVGTRLRGQAEEGPLVIRSRTHVIGIVIGVALAGIACSSEPVEGPVNTALGDDAITVASFDFAESEVLAEIYGQALEANGFEVDRAGRVGARELVQPALAAGIVEFVPEYLGTAVEFLSLGEVRPQRRPEAAHRELERILEGTDLVALAPASAENTNTVVVRRQTAIHFDLETISDLLPFAPGFTFGGPPECPRRPFCLAGLEGTYGLEFAEFLPLDVAGPVTRQALVNGHVDVALGFSTDPSIEDDDLVVLSDDGGLQPAENVTPIVRREVIELGGARFVEVVDAVSGALTTSALRAMNARVAAGDEPADVAGRWLETMSLS